VEGFSYARFRATGNALKKRYISMLAGFATAGLCSSALAQRVGPEFQANTYTTALVVDPAVASDASDKLRPASGTMKRRAE
jgi:hypothetical protein